MDTVTGKEYDVIVIGGGPAGIGAALAAARGGKNVLLAEKSVILGGLSTLGLVVLFNPPLDDGKGRKLVGGLAEEMMHLSVKYGYGSLPPQWKAGVLTGKGPGRYQTVFSAPAFSLALMEILLEEHVDILYDALFSEPVMRAGHCEGVILETKAGRYVYRTQAVIDCSGDADVFHRCGAECIERKENWLSYWALSANLDTMAQAVQCNDISKAIKLEALGSTAQGKNNPEGVRQFGIDSPEEVSDFVIQGQKLALNRLKTFDPYKECFLHLPVMPQMRRTRAIKGLYTVEEKDRDRHMEDSIGCTKEEWQPYFIEIPYRSLITGHCDNVLAAGRIVSSSGVPRDTTRLIAICVLTGEAAGTAAALMIDKKTTVKNLDVGELQRRLVNNGNMIHF